MELYHRADWISASEFHDFHHSDVLERVVEASRRVRAEGQTPIVLFDLDSTLYEVAPRTFAIFSEWLAGETEIEHSARSVLEKVELSHVGYSVKDTFRAAGLNPEEPSTERLVESMKDFWKPRFFSNDYLKHDRPYPGAVAFVRSLYDEGTEIAYLTGRERRPMEQGTKQNLARDGFPLGQRTVLLMKEEAALDDLAHKVQIAESLRSKGRLVASFENEPRNLIGISQLFPEALHIFVETICSDSPAPHGRGLYRIKRFV